MCCATMPESWHLRIRPLRRAMTYRCRLIICPIFSLRERYRCIPWNRACALSLAHSLSLSLSLSLYSSFPPSLCYVVFTYINPPLSSRCPPPTCTLARTYTHTIASCASGRTKGNAVAGEGKRGKRRGAYCQSLLIGA